ncbi:hypothetical protein MIND_01113300 [Mycena indigotica]|uniref:Uncharacterized protein n=1 Tax=Mycena indigotica TaxID=2126181 RepID=A0A8H6VVS9_9AGAR|nr:uncharacterized protein MIND_01113300 [Mycena indigotica]KAF7295727.1 hypothetical protein MIND_01113300 [Mycena indigotica]
MATSSRARTRSRERHGGRMNRQKAQAPRPDSQSETDSEDADGEGEGDKAAAKGDDFELDRGLAPNADSARNTRNTVTDVSSNLCKRSKAAQETAQTAFDVAQRALTDMLAVNDELRVDNEEKSNEFQRVFPLYQGISVVTVRYQRLDDAMAAERNHFNDLLDDIEAKYQEMKMLLEIRATRNVQIPHAIQAARLHLKRFKVPFRPMKDLPVICPATDDPWQRLSSSPITARWLNHILYLPDRSLCLHKAAYLAFALAGQWDDSAGVWRPDSDLSALVGSEKELVVKRGGNLFYVGTRDGGVRFGSGGSVQVRTRFKR